MTVEHRGAWVPPDLASVDPRAALALAVPWLLQQGGQPVIVASRKDVLPREASNLLPASARSWPVLSSLSRGRVQAPARPGPVLAFLPDEAAVEYAVQLASGSALCVLDYGHPAMHGWAVEVGALDLTTGQPVPGERPAELLEALEALLSAGNNGWTGFGQRDARRILDGLRAAGLLDRDLVRGYLVAHGKGHRAVDGLAQLLQAR